MPLVTISNFSLLSVALTEANFISLISGTFSGTNSFSRTCVDFDSNGGLYAATTYNSVRNSTSYKYQTLAAFETDGTLRYNIGYGGGYDDVYGIKATDYVYITGSDIKGTSALWVGRSTKAAGGNVGFTRRGVQATVGTSVAVDSASNVYTAGWTVASSTVCCLMKQSNFSTGAIAWQRSVTGLSYVVSSKVAIDKNDNVYLLGCSLAAPIYKPAFIKLSSAGVIVGQKIITLGADTMYSYDIACDSTGNTVILASSSTLSLVIKLGPSGNILWQKTCPIASSSFKAVAIDSADNVYIAGQTTTDIVILKLDSSGAKLWCNKLSTSQTDTVYSIAVDDKGNFSIGGNIGTTNALIAKLPDDGSKLGTYGIFTYAINAITLTDSAATIADTSAFSLAVMSNTSGIASGVVHPEYVTENTHLTI